MGKNLRRMGNHHIVVLWKGRSKTRSASPYDFFLTKYFFYSHLYLKIRWRKKWMTITGNNGGITPTRGFSYDSIWSYKAKLKNNTIYKTRYFSRQGRRNVIFVQYSNAIPYRRIQFTLGGKYIITNIFFNQKY